MKTWKNYIKTDDLKDRVKRNVTSIYNSVRQRLANLTKKCD